MKSFREQVKTFWKVFFQEEKELRHLIDHMQQNEQEILKRIKRLLDICISDCVFETGKNQNHRYELILTPNGDPLTILYYRTIIEHAPNTLKKVWDFYYAKPKETDGIIHLSLQNQQINVSDIIVYPKSQNQRFHLDVYGEVFLGMQEQDVQAILYECLDACISEMETMSHIGEIHLLKEKRTGGIPLDLLSAYMEEVMEKEQWMNAHHPLQIYTTYAIAPKQENFILRADVYSGISTQINLINEMLRYGNDHVRRAEADGILVGFLFYEHSSINKEQLLMTREGIEEALNQRCETKRVAENIGAANGLFYTYIDYVIYDWELFLHHMFIVMEDVNTQLYGFQLMLLGEPPLYLVDNRPAGNEKA